MSDIGLTNLDGVLVGLALWVLSGLHFVAALGFIVASLRSGEERRYAPSVLLSFAWCGGLWLASFQVRHLPNLIARALDATVLFWIVPFFGLGVWTCFVARRKRAGRSDGR
jgi:hypothetical protein